MATVSPAAALPPDKVKHLPAEAVQRTYTSNPELELWIERAKEVLSHSLPTGADHADLLKKVFEIALNQVDPIKKEARREERKAKLYPATPAMVDESVTAASKMTGHKLGNPKPVSHKLVNYRPIKRKYISVEPKRKLYVRDGYSCSHMDPVTKRRCGSRYKLETDHVIPLALGGSDDLDNLRLVCRAHNSLYAIRSFGRDKMAKFIPSLR